MGKMITSEAFRITSYFHFCSINLQRSQVLPRFGGREVNTTRKEEGQRKMMLSALNGRMTVSVILVGGYGQKILRCRFLCQTKQAELEREWMQRVVKSGGKTSGSRLTASLAEC